MQAKPYSLTNGSTVMNKRRIGTTQYYVSEIGYGAMHLSIDRTKRPDEGESIALIKRAIDELGVDFIDTADSYCADDSETGHNERIIRQALQDGRADRVVVATKGGSVRPGGRWERDGSPEHLRSACEASLRALGVERIQLYQLHAPDPEVPIEESAGALADLQREGKIEYIGLSNVTIAQIGRAMKEATIVSVQNRFSVLKDNAQDEVLEFCEDNQMTFIPWNPVGGRGDAPHLDTLSLTLGDIGRSHDVSPHAIALAWLLQRSASIIPIPGTRTFEHLKENVEAAEVELTDEEVQRLDRESAALA